MAGLALRGRRPRRQACRQGARVAHRTTDGRERVINQLLHRQPTGLDRAQHGLLRFRLPVTDWTVASRLNSMFLAAAEFGEACREFPIVFVRAGAEPDGTPQIAPVAVFGLGQEENLFLDGARW